LWVAREIVSVEDLKIRTIVLNRFIVIAQECRSLHNYNAVMEIMAGLQQTSVYRLQETWSLLPTQTWNIWDSLIELVKSGDNFGKLRQELLVAPLPCIPYLGLFLTDLTFIEDANESILPGTNFINFIKLRYISEVIEKIQTYQTLSFNLDIVEFIQDYLTQNPVLTETELYKLSLICEEKKRPLSLKSGKVDKKDKEKK